MNYQAQLKNTYQIIKFSLPISTGLIINMISSFLGMLMVARIGQLELAGAALAVPTFMTIMTTTSMIFYAIGILISHATGQQKDSEDIGEIVKNGFWLALILFISSSFILWHIDKVLIFFKQDPLLVKLTTQYFHFAAFAMLPLLIGAVLTQLFTGIGNSKFIMRVSLFNFPLILFFSYGFILGKFGFPQLGLAGITCASFLAQTLTFCLVFVYIMYNKNLKEYKIFKVSFLDIPMCKKIFTLGFPIGLQFGGELAAMAMSTYLMGFFGVSALAASQIVSQYTILILMIILGVSQGSSILMSAAFAKNNFVLIRLYFNSMLIIIFALFILIFSAFSLIPDLLMKPFIKNSNINNELMLLTNQFFIIASFMLLFDGLRNILSAGLRGLHDSKTSMRLGIICLWLISLPTSYIVAFIFNEGPVGLRLGFISGYIVAAIMLWSKILKKINQLDRNLCLTEGI